MGWGSRIRDPGFGSRGQRAPSSGFRIRICNTGIVTYWRFPFGLARRESTDTTVDFRFRCRSSGESRQAASQTILSRVSSPLSWLQVWIARLLPSPPLQSPEFYSCFFVCDSFPDPFFEYSLRDLGPSFCFILRIRIFFVYVFPNWILLFCF
jgi:hypothetical protein